MAWLTGRAAVVAGHDGLLVVAEALPVVCLAGLDARLGRTKAGLDDAVFETCQWPYSAGVMARKQSYVSMAPPQPEEPVLVELEVAALEVVED